MRILFFMGVYLPRTGGVPRNTHNMVMRLRDMGVDVEVLAPHEVGDKDCNLSYPVYRYPRWPVKRLFTRAYLAWLWTILKRKRIDLVHCHGVDPAAYCASFFKSLCKVPYIVTPRRTNLLKVPRHMLHIRRNRRVERGLCHANCVTALSSEIARIVRACGVPEERIVMIPHGIDPLPFERVEPMKRSRPYFLALGRMVAFKGFDCLIKAFAMIAGKYPVIDLVIIGSGPKMASLKRLAAKIGLTHRVLFTGRKEGIEKMAWYKGAKAFVLPSRPGNEGFPNVLLEAMAAGLPIIATRVSGAEDVVIPGVTGYLVPPSNIVELASTMDTFLENEQAIERQTVKKYLEPYHIDRIIGRYKGLYERLLRLKETNAV